MKAAAIQFVLCVLLGFSFAMVGSDVLNMKFGFSVKLADRFVTLFNQQYRPEADQVLLFSYSVLVVILLVVFTDWCKATKKALGG